MVEQSKSRLPALQVWFYGLPALALTAVGIPLLLYLVPFYTKDKGLHPEVVGGILFAVRLADAVFDPTFGAISDRVRTRWGRRRPWLFGGTIVLIIAIWHTFMPPEEVSTGYFLFWMLVLYASWTVVIVPYAAWGAELTGDFNERTRIAGIRELFLLVGTVLAASVPTVLKTFGQDSLTHTMEAIGIFVMVGLPIAIGLMFWKVPDAQIIDTGHGHHSWRAGINAIRKNGPFARLISAFLLNAIAQAMVATLFFFYVGTVLEAGDMAAYLLLTYFISGIVAVPLWMRLAERFGKHRTWAFSMISSAGIFLITPFLGAGDVWIFWVISVLTGASLGCDQILAASMQADVVDVDSIRSGQQRAGLYFALWNMVTKLAGGIAAGITLPLLGYYGFSAGAATNPPKAVTALIVLFAVLPPILRFMSVRIIWNYPITRERHAKLRAGMERKLARRAAATEAKEASPAE